MIKHIFKLILNQRSSNIWIWVEMMIVAMVLWFTLDKLYTYAYIYVQPLGYDITNTYQIHIENNPDRAKKLGIEFDEQQDGENALKIFERIRAYPDVEAMALSLYSLPQDGSTNSDRFYVDTTNTVSCLLLTVTKDYFRVFRVANKEGSIDAMVNALGHSSDIILSEDAQSKIFGQESAIGKEILKDDKSKYTVKEIAPYFRKGSFKKQMPFIYQLYDEQEIAKTGLRARSTEISVRVKQGVEADFTQKFMRDMKNSLQLGAYYLTDVTSISDSYMAENGFVQINIKQNISIMLFVLVNVFLGIIGTFWYKTEQRKEEMGLRMAMGSTRARLRNLMIGEGIMLMIMALVPAAVISLNIAMAEMIEVKLVEFSLMRFVIVQLATIVAMSLMIIIGIGIPANKTSKLRPSEALKYE